VSTDEDDENYDVGKNRKPEYKRGIKNSLERRFSCSLNTFNDRYLIIFGGAGKFIRKIQRRETFNSLYFLDRFEERKNVIESAQRVINISKSASNSTIFQQSKSFDSVDDLASKNDENFPKWIDMSEDPTDCPEKVEIMNSAKFDKAQINYGKGGDIKDFGAPRCRTQHASAVYGGCFMVHGGF